MGRSERVELAFHAAREAGQAPRLAERANSAPPPRQDLVRIGLVADVPDQPVAWRVEQIMQSDGQLDDAESSAQMAAGDRDRIDQLLPELGGELR